MSAAVGVTAGRSSTSRAVALSCLSLLVPVVSASSQPPWAKEHLHAVDEAEVPRSLDITFLPLRQGRAVRTRGALQPTDWRTYFDSPSCVKEQSHALNQDNFMQCTTSAPIIYSKKMKFAYLKTPKVASTAFFEYFRQQFPDSVELSVGDMFLPADTFIFTFVRNPFHQKLAGYAEIDLKQEEATWKERKNARTRFQRWDRKKNRGQDRFLKFLEDIEKHRFREHDDWAPLHARAQVAAVLCTHQVQFIGHLERLERDWAEIQELAKIPLSMRTEAVPSFHASETEREKVYRADENVPLSHEIKTKICQLFPSDFVCLGYEMPLPCVEAGLGPNTTSELP